MVRCIVLAATCVLLLLSGQVSFACEQSSPEHLSRLAREIIDRVEVNATPGLSPVPIDKLVTHCNNLNAVMVDGPQIYSTVRNALANAKHEVLIAFFKWDKNSWSVEQIMEGIAEASRKLPRDEKLEVRIIINNLTLFDVLDPTGTLDRDAINTIYDSTKPYKNLDINFHLATYGHSAFGALHDKFIVIDDQALFLTGANPESKHDPGGDFTWHDTGYILSGPVVRAGQRNFDDLWTRHSQEWDCKPRTARKDCQIDDTILLPSRPWQRVTTEASGSVSMAAIGRKATGSRNNRTDNPQAQAVISMFELANSLVNIQSPNINDDAFQSALINALSRGVTINLITSYGFNGSITGADAPGQGGENREVVAKLRRQVESRVAAQYRDRLNICWYSEDRSEPKFGNKSSNAHTKYLSVDSRVALIGSGNMDTQSWNNSHEFNILIDSMAVVRELERAFYDRNLNSSVCSYIELYDKKKC